MAGEVLPVFTQPIEPAPRQQPGKPTAAGLGAGLGSDAISSPG